MAMTDEERHEALAAAVIRLAPQWFRSRAVLGMGVCVWLMVNTAAEKLMIGAGALVVGAFLYLFMRWRYGVDDSDPITS